MTIKESIGESLAGWQYAISHVQAKAGEATTVVRREIGESVLGLSYIGSLAAAKGRETVTGAQESIGKSVTGLGMGVSHVAGRVGESFGNISKAATSWKYPLYITIGILLFIAVMVSIGYSGLGAPTARVAEREYVHRR